MLLGRGIKVGHEFPVSHRLSTRPRQLTAHGCAAMGEFPLARTGHLVGVACMTDKHSCSPTSR